MDVLTIIKNKMNKKYVEGCSRDVRIKRRKERGREKKMKRE